VEVVEAAAEDAAEDVVEAVAEAVEHAAWWTSSTPAQQVSMHALRVHLQTPLGGTTHSQ